MVRTPVCINPIPPVALKHVIAERADSWSVQGYLVLTTEAIVATSFTSWLDERACHRIVLLEAGPYVSFANCGLPYYLGGEIAQRESLFVVPPKLLQMRFRIDVRVGTRAESVDRQAKTVALAGPDGQREDLAYDRLILATGTTPIVPAILGVDRPDVFSVRTVPDVDAITEHIARTTPTNGEPVQKPHTPQPHHEGPPGDVNDVP